MTHPTSLARPLLIHALAAAVLCPLAFAKPKSNAEPAKSSRSAATAPANSSKTVPGKSAAANDAKSSAAKTGTAAITGQAKGKKYQTAVSAKGAGKGKPALEPSPAAKAAYARAQAANASPAGPQPRAQTVIRPAFHLPRGRVAGVPQIRQTQGDAPPPDNRPDHRALIIPRDELLARVPGSGMLNEEDCILIGIANHPMLQKRRAQIGDATAERAKEKDWENPELRLSYGSQSDDLVRNPYVERTIENMLETEEFEGTEATTSLANPGEFGFGESTTDNETGTSTTKRYREIERIVTPGRFGETVTTNIYETREDGTTSVRERTIDIGGFQQTRRDQLVENVERTLRSSTTETTTSNAENGKQEAFELLLRLRMPHPWIKKARLARAAAEITLAEAQYLADEDKFVRDVRELFQELAIRQSTLNVHNKRRANFAAFRTEMEGAPLEAFAEDAMRASIDMADVLNDASRARSEADNIRAKIAILCGIADPRRIHSSGVVTRRIIDHDSLNESYLTDMAMLYRADAVESRARFGIAKALLEEAKAAKIPWATFIDASYTRQWRDGYSGGEDEWMIRIGVEIPFFDWVGINKRSKAYQKAAVEWEKQFEMQRQFIANNVHAAVMRVKAAYRELKSFDDSVKSEQAGIKGRLTKLDELARGFTGLTKQKRFKYDAEDATQILELGRYRKYSEYNEAILDLEDVIGIRIEKVLSGEFSK